jgi:hypothetical protein
MNLRHELILEEARIRIDELNEDANRLKLGVLREAKGQADARIKSASK